MVRITGLEPVKIHILSVTRLPFSSYALVTMMGAEPIPLATADFKSAVAAFTPHSIVNYFNLYTISKKLKFFRICIIGQFTQSHRNITLCNLKVFEINILA